LECIQEEIKNSNKINKTLTDRNNELDNKLSELTISLEKKNFVNNLFVYLDYGDKTQLTACLNKMKFNIVKSGNNTIDFKIPFSLHGSQYNDYKSRNFIINFDPRDISTRDGFVTIINTKNNIEGFYQDTAQDTAVDPINSLFSKYLDLYLNDTNLTVAAFINRDNNKESIKNIDLNTYNEKIDDNLAKNKITDSDTITFFKSFITDLISSIGTTDISPVTTPSASTNTITDNTPTVITPTDDTLTDNTSSDVAPYSSNAAPYSSNAAPYSSNVSPLATLSTQQNTTQGSIYFSQDLINNLIKDKKSCLYVKFWLASFNFAENKIISVNDKKGPYKQINFVGNPKIIIYIPPYVINDKKHNDSNRKKVITSLIQENENICDIYINISY
jgi:hypothetical protein